MGFNRVARFLLLPLLVAKFASANPKISFISGPEVVVDVGTKAEMECRVENGKEYPINWIKIREERGQNYEYLPLSTGKNLIVRDNRFKVTYDPIVSSYTLQILDVQDIDSATYQCQVIIGLNNKITEEVVLKVRMSPSFVEEPETKLSGIEGEAIDMSCKVDGFPSPSVQWTRPDGKFMPGSSSMEMSGETLSIRSLRREDSGMYTCTADNKVGDPISQNITLEVKFPPKISVPRPRIHQAIGYGVTLACEIQANPIPAIHWSKGEEVIVNDGVHSVSHFTKSKSTIVSTIKISYLTEEHFGTYKCEGRNVYGEETQELELYKTSMPIPEAVYSSAAKESIQLHMLGILTFLLCIITV